MRTRNRQAPSIRYHTPHGDLTFEQVIDQQSDWAYPVTVSFTVKAGRHDWLLDVILKWARYMPKGITVSVQPGGTAERVP